MSVPRTCVVCAGSVEPGTRAVARKFHPRTYGTVPKPMCELSTVLLVHRFPFGCNGQMDRQLSCDVLTIRPCQLLSSVPATRTLGRIALRMAAADPEATAVVRSCTAGMKAGVVDNAV